MLTTSPRRKAIAEVMHTAKKMNLAVRYSGCVDVVDDSSCCALRLDLFFLVGRLFDILSTKAYQAHASRSYIQFYLCEWMDKTDNISSDEIASLSRVIPIAIELLLTTIADPSTTSTHLASGSIAGGTH